MRSLMLFLGLLLLLLLLQLRFLLSLVSLLLVPPWLLVLRLRRRSVDPGLRPRRPRPPRLLEMLEGIADQDCAHAAEYTRAPFLDHGVNCSLVVW